jgi:hypothetical protein
MWQFVEQISDPNFLDMAESEFGSAFCKIREDTNYATILARKTERLLFFTLRLPHSNNPSPHVFVSHGET